MARKREPVSPEEAERGREVAEMRMRSPAWGEPYGVWDDDLGLPTPSQRYVDRAYCGAMIRSSGLPCGIFAGVGTAHEGVGACFRHDSPVERAAGAWTVAHVIARIQDISPWEALLLAVKRAAAWASFYDTKLGQAPDDDALAPNGSHHHWVVAAERVNDKLARYSKMAVDAGVAAMLVQRAQAEGAEIARVLNAAIADAGLGEEAEMRLRSALRNALVAMASEETGVIEGSLADDENA